MKYAYEDLSPDQFENLVVVVCQELLGMGTQKYSLGGDEGRDARFEGTANEHPSRSAPWTGVTVVQAKHTIGVNRYFAEKDFYNPQNEANTVLGKELPKVVALRAKKQVDNYFLFANRRLGANTEEEIRSHIAARTGIPSGSVSLCGVEQLELHLRRYPHLPSIAKLDPIDAPLNIDPFQLAEVVQALARSKPGLGAVGSVAETTPAVRTSYKRKNELNGMSDEYAKRLRKRFLKDSYEIERFLADPVNAEMLALYEDTVDDFQAKVIAKRKDHQSFDEVMNYLIDFLFKRDPILAQNEHRRITRALVFHMYWHCDIGRVEDAETV